MLEDLKPPTRRKPCRVEVIKAELNETDAVIFINAVDDVNLWRANTLSREFKRLSGKYIADVTITRHRQRQCACYDA